jgi:hypothetical protein
MEKLKVNLYILALPFLIILTIIKNFIIDYIWTDKKSILEKDMVKGIIIGFEVIGAYLLIMNYGALGVAYVGLTAFTLYFTYYVFFKLK